ncbi:hypothetical protein OPT61_g7790 [Boeremia exigua]|uniref:Uncharacterized protein n=1 Tax=Boeremia exigua TaxID=749465 RepID=A0ACC2I177_9PLEO|nr:hypothetical protein OPT61_g7790 [Boeremia exigua]
MTTSSTLLELVITMVWACLQVTGSQNRLFAQLFFAVNVVSDVAAAASLTFCPGLLEALNAKSPPSVSWFKSLPDDYRGKWGVYVLVFEKHGLLPHLYCGSATDSDDGISSRWMLYDRHNIKLGAKIDRLPRGVFKAFQAGYKIKHKGLLVTAPIPPAANVPMVRLLFYALEATMSFCFWMMDTNKFFAYHVCCRWPLESFSYKGLCSHSALYDSIKGRFDLSPEQLTTLAVDVAEKKRAWHRAYRATLMATDPEARLALERIYAATYRDLNRDACNARSRQYTADNLQTVRETKDRSSKKTKESGIYSCKLCGVDCKSNWELARHNKSSSHKTNVRKEKEGVIKSFVCRICNYSTEVKGSMKRHKEGKNHIKKAAAHKAARQAASSTT